MFKVKLTDKDNCKRALGMQIVSAMTDKKNEVALTDECKVHCFKR